MFEIATTRQIDVEWRMSFILQLNSLTLYSYVPTYNIDRRDVVKFVHNYFLLIINKTKIVNYFNYLYL